MKKLPEGWKEVEFLDSLEKEAPNNKYKIQGKDFLKKGKYPIIDQGESFIAGYTNDKSKVYSEKLPVVIFGDHTRIFKFVDFPFALGADGVKILVPKKEINVKYYFFYLRSLPILSAGYSRHYKFLKEKRIILPPLPVQQKIVSILEKAETAKELRKQADELTDTFLKAVFYEMFGNGKKIKQIELFKVAEIVMGQSPPGDSYNEKGKGMPFFQGKAEFTERYPVVKKWTTKPTKLARPNSILMSVRAPVGSVNICNLNCCIGRGLASIYPKEELKLEFLFSILQVLEEKIANMGTGSTFKAINSDQLRTIKIPLPPIELQQKFASIVQEVEAIKEQQKKSKEYLDDLFNALMQKAFKGELIA